MNRDKGHESVGKKWFIPGYFQGTSWINSDGGKHWGLSDYFILSLWGDKKERKEKWREGWHCSLCKCCVPAVSEEDNTGRILQRRCHGMHIGLVKGKNKCSPFVLWCVLNICKQEREYIYISHRQNKANFAVTQKYVEKTARELVLGGGVIILHIFDGTNSLIFWWSSKRRCESPAEEFIVLELTGFNARKIKFWANMFYKPIRFQLLKAKR